MGERWVVGKGTDFLASLRRGGSRLARIGARAAATVGGGGVSLPHLEPEPYDPTPTYKSVARDAHLNFLGREPSPDELDDWARMVREDQLLWEHLQVMHSSNPRFETIAKPVVAEIQTLYERFLFRAPTLREIVDHWGRFRVESAEDEDHGLRAVRDGEAARRVGVRPLHLEMDILNQCNIRCVMCHFSLDSVSKRKKQEMSVEDFARVADELFPVCKHVSLSFNTEPLLHRRFGDILDVAGRYRVPSLYMITNAMLLKPATIELLIRHRVSLCVSVDGATKETYERIRAGAKFDRLVANLNALREAKVGLPADHPPSLHLNFVLMRSNIRELPDFVRLGKELGASSVGAVHLVPYEGVDMEAESLDQDKALCNEMLQQAREVGREVGLATYFPGDFREAPAPGAAAAVNEGLPFLPTTGGEPQASRCRFPWHWVGLTPEGEIRPCGWWYGEAPMGNIRTQSFGDIWNSEPYRNLRAEHMEGRLRQACLTCPAAGMGDLDGGQAFKVKKHFLDVKDLTMKS